MDRKYKVVPSYIDDDRSRYAGPEYLDRVSLSKAYDHYLPPKGYHRSDARIYEEVCEALMNDPAIDASKIEIEVHDGIVNLTGSVDDREMKKEVEICVEHINGVEDVFNMINLYQFSEAGSQGLVKNQARLNP